MPKLLDKSQISRLQESMTWSRGQMQKFRENRKKIVDEFVGAHYAISDVQLGGDFMDARAVPVNMIYFAATIYSRALASNNPQCYITTSDETLDPGAFKLSGALNHVSLMLKLGKIFNRTALDALFSIGAVKVGVTTYGKATPTGFNPATGCPYVLDIDLDDLILDMVALARQDLSYIGNRYRIPIETVKKNPRYSKKAVDRLQPSPLRLINQEGDPKIGSITRDESYDEEFDDCVELVDVFLPARGGRPPIIMTMEAEPGSDDTPPLYMDEYIGPENQLGPYHLLGFTEVPGQLFPLAPGAMWLDLHHLINCLYRKLGSQALREKTVGITTDGSDDVAKRVMEAGDGDVVGGSGQMQDPIREYHFGGANPQTWGTCIQSLQLFKSHFGNLDALAGLGPQADTLGQDQLISAAANKMVQGMAEETLSFAEGVMKSLAHYLLEDPLIKLPIKHYVAEYDTWVNYEFTPENDMGSLLDYTIKIHPYSMQHITPAQRLQGLIQFMNIITPALPQAQQQGATLDWKEFSDIYGQLSNLDELKRIFKFSQRPPETEDQVQGTADALKAPAVSRRETVRTNRSGTTPAGQENAMIAMAMGGGAKQPAEMARGTRNLG